MEKNKVRFTHLKYHPIIYKIIGNAIQKIILKKSFPIEY